MKRDQVYQCMLCGNVLEIRHASGPIPVCCGKELRHLEEKTADKTTEKHVPVLEKTEEGYKVTVGSTLHPMEDKHYIAFVQLVGKESTYTKYFKAGDKPVAEFKCKDEIQKAREYCILHGLWSSEI